MFLTSLFGCQIKICTLVIRVDGQTRSIYTYDTYKDGVENSKLKHVLLKTTEYISYYMQVGETPGYQSISFLQLLILGENVQLRSFRLEI